MSCKINGMIKSIGNQFKKASDSLKSLFKGCSNFQCTICGKTQSFKPFFVDKEDKSVVLCPECFAQSQKQTEYVAIKNQQQLQRLRIRSLEYDSEEEIDLQIPAQSLVIEMLNDDSKVLSERQAVRESIVISYLPKKAEHTLHEQFEKAQKLLESWYMKRPQSETGYMNDLKNLLGKEKVEKHEIKIKQQVRQAIQAGLPRQKLLSNLMDQFMID